MPLQSCTILFRHPSSGVDLGIYFWISRQGIYFQRFEGQKRCGGYIDSGYFLGELEIKSEGAVGNEEDISAYLRLKNPKHSAPKLKGPKGTTLQFTLRTASVFVGYYY